MKTRNIAYFFIIQTTIVVTSAAIILYAGSRTKSDSVEETNDHQFGKKPVRRDIYANIRDDYSNNASAEEGSKKQTRAGPTNNIKYFASEIENKQVKSDVVGDVERIVHEPAISLWRHEVAKNYTAESPLSQYRVNAYRKIISANSAINKLQIYPTNTAQSVSLNALCMYFLKTEFDSGKVVASKIYDREGQLPTNILLMGLRTTAGIDNLTTLCRSAFSFDQRENTDVAAQTWAELQRYVHRARIDGLGVKSGDKMSLPAMGEHFAYYNADWSDSGENGVWETQLNMNSESRNYAYSMSSVDIRVVRNSAFTLIVRPGHLSGKIADEYKDTLYKKEEVDDFSGEVQLSQFVSQAYNERTKKLMAGLDGVHQSKIDAVNISVQRIDDRLFSPINNSHHWGNVRESPDRQSNRVQFTMSGFFWPETLQLRCRPGLYAITVGSSDDYLQETISVRVLPCSLQIVGINPEYLIRRAGRLRNRFHAGHVRIYNENGRVMFNLDRECTDIGIDEVYFISLGTTEDFGVMISQKLPADVTDLYNKHVHGTQIHVGFQIITPFDRPQKEWEPQIFTTVNRDPL